MALRSALLAAAVIALAAPSAASATPGGLRQPDGVAGCINNDGSSGCTDASPGMAEVADLSISPDGRHVYAATRFGMAAFSRNPDSGALQQLPGTDGCFTAGGSGGLCATARGIADSDAVVVAPDGRHVYLTGVNTTPNPDHNFIAIFARDPDSGRLTQIPGTAGCLSDRSNDCIKVPLLEFPTDLAVSPDGATAYAPVPFNNAVLTFLRNQSSGALGAPAPIDGCDSKPSNSTPCETTELPFDRPGAVAVAPDGRQVAAVASSSDSIVGLTRNEQSGYLTAATCVSNTGDEGACADGRVLDNPAAVAYAPSGRRMAAVASSATGGLTILNRNTSNNVLQQALVPRFNPPGVIPTCTNAAASEGCKRALGLVGANDVAISPDGSHAYATATGSQAVTAFTMAGATQLAPATEGCVATSGGADTDGCMPGRSLQGPSDVEVSPDGRFVYVGSFAGSGIAVLAREVPAAPPGDGSGGGGGGDGSGGDGSGGGGSGGDGGPGGGGGSGGAGTDTTVPSISSLRASPKAFAVAKGATPVAARVRRGGRLTFKLSELAAVRVDIERPAAGRLSGKKCVKPKPSLAKRKRCTRYVRVATLTRVDRPAGTNKLPFSGRIGKRALAVGRYRATVTATDLAGNRSKPRRVSFSVVRG